ncbi:unnamed protein product, partial [Prorocentrum cordatum]
RCSGGRLPCASSEGCRRTSRQTSLAERLLSASAGLGGSWPSSPPSWSTCCSGRRGCS